MWCLQHPKIEPHEVFLSQPAKTQPTPTIFILVKENWHTKDVLKFY